MQTGRVKSGRVHSYLALLLILRRLRFIKIKDTKENEMEFNEIKK